MQGKRSYSIDEKYKSLETEKHQLQPKTEGKKNQQTRFFKTRVQTASHSPALSCLLISLLRSQTAFCLTCVALYHYTKP